MFLLYLVMCWQDTNALLHSFQYVHPFNLLWPTFYKNPTVSDGSLKRKSNIDSNTGGVYITTSAKLKYNGKKCNRKGEPTKGPTLLQKARKRSLKHLVAFLSFSFCLSTMRSSSTTFQHNCAVPRRTQSCGDQTLFSKLCMRSCLNAVCSY